MIIDQIHPDLTHVKGRKKYLIKTGIYPNDLISLIIIFVLENR
jgi:hypothetical protein